MVENFDFKEAGFEEFAELSKGELIEVIAFAKVGDLRELLKNLGYCNVDKFKKAECIELIKIELEKYDKPKETKKQSSKIKETQDNLFRKSDDLDDWDFV